MFDAIEARAAQPFRHNLATNADGSRTMAYTGETPWHALGTAVSEAMTSEQAIKASGLGYTVGLRGLVTTDGAAVDVSKAVVREDNGAVLGVVGNRWKPVQNSEAFDFLDGLIGDGSLRYHTVGALGKGEKIWLLAKLPGEIQVAKDDVTEKYLLLSNNHDGFSSLKAMFTPIRVVCQNTLSMALSQTNGAAVVNIRHTGNLTSKLAQARRVLGLADRFFEVQAKKFQDLASVKLNADAALGYFQTVFPLPEDAEKNKRAADIATETHDALLNLFEEGKGARIKGVKNTLWTAYNAVTEYVDHVKENPRAKKMEALEAQSSRLNNMWFGPGATLKAEAFDKAMAFLR